MANATRCVLRDRTDLYRYYDAAGRLLYVGISFNAIARAIQHRAHKDWWVDVVRMEVEHLPTRADALEAEREAVRLERPLHNVALNQRDDHRTWSVPGNTIEIVRGAVITHRGHVVLVVERCPGCGRKHRHGLTPDEARRGWAHRFPHCGDTGPWGRSSTTPWQIIRFGRRSEWLCELLEAGGMPGLRMKNFDTEAEFFRARDRRMFARWLD